MSSSSEMRGEKNHTISIQQYYAQVVALHVPTAKIIVKRCRNGENKKTSEWEEIWSFISTPTFHMYNIIIYMYIILKKH